MLLARPKPNKYRWVHDEIVWSPDTKNCVAPAENCQILAEWAQVKFDEDGVLKRIWCQLTDPPIPGDPGERCSPSGLARAWIEDVVESQEFFTMDGYLTETKKAGVWGRECFNKAIRPEFCDDIAAAALEQLPDDTYYQEVVEAALAAMEFLPGGHTKKPNPRVDRTYRRLQNMTEALCAANPMKPGESAQLYGTRIHGLLEKQIKSLGDPELSAELSYKGSKIVPRGTKGSKRPDVTFGPSKNQPIAFFDLKTGASGISKRWRRALLGVVGTMAPNGFWLMELTC